MLVAMAEEAGHHVDDKWKSPNSDADVDEEQATGLMAIAKHIAMQETRQRYNRGDDKKYGTAYQQSEDENFEADDQQGLDS